jgi:hypothetical protein
MKADARAIELDSSLTATADHVRRDLGLLCVQIRLLEGHLHGDLRGSGTTLRHIITFASRIDGILAVLGSP